MVKFYLAQINKGDPVVIMSDEARPEVVLKKYAERRGLEIMKFMTSQGGSFSKAFVRGSTEDAILVVQFADPIIIG